MELKDTLNQIFEYRIREEPEVIKQLIDVLIRDGYESFEFGSSFAVVSGLDDNSNDEWVLYLSESCFGFLYQSLFEGLSKVVGWPIIERINLV